MQRTLTCDDDLLESWFESLPERVQKDMLSIPYTLRGEAASYLPNRMTWAAVRSASGDVDGVRDWVRRRRFDAVAALWWNSLDAPTRHSLQRYPRQPLRPCAFGSSVPHPLLAPSFCWPTEDLQYDAEYLDDDILEWVVAKVD